MTARLTFTRIVPRRFCTARFIASDALPAARPAAMLAGFPRRSQDGQRYGGLACCQLRGAKRINGVEDERRTCGGYPVG